MSALARGATGVALVAVVVLAACDAAAPIPGDAATASRTPSAATDAEASGTARASRAPQSPPPGVAASISAPGAPLGVAFGFDSIWVSSHRGRNLYRIDPDTNALAATIDIRSTACGDIGIGEREVWLLTCPAGRTLRIDPETNQVASVAPVPGNAMPGFGAGSVWLATGVGPGGKLVRVDASTDRVEAEIPVGSSPAYVVYAFDAVWVSNFDDATVSRVDPATNRVVATVPVGPPGGAGSGYMAAAEDSLWVANTADRQLYRIDPGSSSSRPVDIGAKPLTQFFDWFVASGMGSVWVRREDRVVAQIDPRSSEIVAEYPAGRGGGDVGAADGILWVANFGDNNIWRVNLE